jgi:SPX domain protein involved in polyphosphate accumulation
MESQVVKYRNEIKFLSKNKDVAFGSLFALGYIEIFHERLNNSIYYDSLDLKGYYENLNGDKDRVKYRARFYGNLDEQNVAFEKKIKKGSVNRKDVSFSKMSNTDWTQSTFPQEESLKPIVHLKYRRRYFWDPVNRIRCTVDWALESKSYRDHFWLKHSKIIVEFKSDTSHNEFKVPHHFSLNTRFSKYAYCVSEHRLPAEHY